MSLFFSPPVAPLVPMAVKPQHPAYPLFKHYRNMDAGINLFVINGVVTTVEPEYEFVKPDKVYLGGHIYTLTVAEAAVLTAAGYTVVGGPDPVVNAGLPGFPVGSSSPNLGVDDGLMTAGVGVGPLGLVFLGGQ